jgi:hypothetical protein
LNRPTTQRHRLAAVEGELAALQAQYELAMSAFKFDEADALQRRISVLEGEQRVLAAELPAPPPDPEPPTGVVLILRRPRRPAHLRRRR